MSKTMMRIPSEIIARVCGFIIRIVPSFIGDTVINISQRGRAAATSQGDAGCEMRLSSGCVIGMVGMMRRPSTRGQRGLLRYSAPLKWTMGLDVTRRGPEAGRAFIKTAVDMNVSELPTLRAGFIVIGMITGKGCIMIAPCPPDFSTSGGNLFFLGQGR